MPTAYTLTFSDADNDGLLVAAKGRGASVEDILTAHAVALAAQGRSEMVAVVVPTFTDVERRALRDKAIDVLTPKPNVNPDSEVIGR